MARFRERKRTSVDAVRLQCPVQLANGNGTEIAEAGDYLVTDSNGSQFLMDQAEFEVSYEPVKTSPGRRKKTEMATITE